MNECCVCFETDNVCYTNCNHLLCKDCYKLLYVKNCPLCRGKLCYLRKKPINLKNKIQVQTINGYKHILAKNLVAYVFSNQFKILIETTLFKMPSNFFVANSYIFYTILRGPIFCHYYIANTKNIYEMTDNELMEICIYCYDVRIVVDVKKYIVSYRPDLHLKLLFHFLKI